jgi:hypothetical protein
MKIAITGQTSLRQLADLLNQPAAIPRGLGGIPPLHEIRGLLARGDTARSSRSTQHSGG